MRTLELKKENETAQVVLGKFKTAFRIYWRDNVAVYCMNSDGKSWSRMLWDVKREEVQQMQKFVDSAFEYLK